MLNGDISNMGVPITAFNLDTLLFSNAPPEKKSVMEKVSSFITLKAFNERDRYFDRELNTGFLSTVKNIWLNFNTTIVLVTFQPFVKDIDTFLYDEQKFQYYSCVQGFADLDELEFKLGNEYSLYVDGSYENVNYLIGGAVHISELGKYFPIGNKKKY